MKGVTLGLWLFLLGKQENLAFVLGLHQVKFQGNTKEFAFLEREAGEFSLGSGIPTPIVQPAIALVDMALTTKIMVL